MSDGVPPWRFGRLSCEERQELEQAEASAAAEAAAYQATLVRHGYPRAGWCLGCDAPHTISAPGDRLCQSCRARAASLDDRPETGGHCALESAGARTSD